MRRNWIIGGVAVAVGAALLLGGQFWASRRAPLLGNAGPAGAASLLGQGGTPDQTASSSANTTGSSAPVAPEKASEPAADGTLLVKLSHAPTKTIGGFDSGYLPANGRYIVTLRPYGFGPADAGRPTLVAMLVTVTGLPGVTGGEKLVGRTIVLGMAPASAAAYVKGGTYTALLSCLTNARGIVLQLSPPMSAAAAKQAYAAMKPKKK